MSANTEGTTRERLLQSGAKLFAEKGFGGVSIRTICADADASVNMVHHYFGNKKGLLDAIGGQLNVKVFAIPRRLLQTMPESKQAFWTRMELVFATTLEAHIEHRSLVMVVVREEVDTPGIQDFAEQFAEFLERAKREGFVRQELNSRMATGAILDRVFAQISFAPWIKRLYGLDILTDEAYRTEWCKTNVDLFLNGIVQA